MPFLPARSRVSSHLIAFALIAGAAGCRDDGTATISGDVARLDSIGALGDSLFARAGASPSFLDSLRMSGSAYDARASSSRRAADSGAVPARRVSAGTNDMTARAHARGDSLARAIASNLAARPGDRTHGDTVRGVIALVDAGEARSVALRTGNGMNIALSGMATTGLSKLVGAELMVRGIKTGPRDIVVSDYVVRAMDGVPAIDGKLGSANGTWFLEMSDGSGRRRLSSVPAALQGQEGARVWIVVGSGAAPSRSHGVIGRR